MSEQNDTQKTESALPLVKQICVKHGEFVSKRIEKVEKELETLQKIQKNPLNAPELEAIEKILGKEFTLIEEFKEDGKISIRIAEKDYRDQKIPPLAALMLFNGLWQQDLPLPDIEEEGKIIRLRYKIILKEKWEVEISNKEYPLNEMVYEKNSEKLFLSRYIEVKSLNLIIKPHEAGVIIENTGELLKPPVVCWKETPVYHVGIGQTMIIPNHWELYVSDHTFRPVHFKSKKEVAPQIPVTGDFTLPIAAMP